MSRDLIVFGEDWGAHPSSTQHLMKRLSTDRKVIWVNSIGLRRPRLSMKDMRRATNKLGRVFRPKPRIKPVHVPENMTVIDPMAIPLPGNATAAVFNRLTIGRAVRTMMAERCIERPLLWASLPTAVDLLNSFSEDGVIYYCGDDFGGLAGVDHQPVLKCEERLAQAADIILAASESLCSRFRTRNTHYLPHGVDLDLFSRDTDPASDLPTNTPVAGFYGSISEWIDTELIAECAQKLTHWKFVFIGDVRTNISVLRDIPNIEFLGPRPHDDLPRYAQHWTASMLPFRDNAQIRACNPLKMREYLATGRPVVSTPFPALTPYREHVLVSNTPESFALSLESTTHEPVENSFHRVQAVAGESWGTRADQVRQLIDT